MRSLILGTIKKPFVSAKESIVVSQRSAQAVTWFVPRLSLGFQNCEQLNFYKLMAVAIISLSVIISIIISHH